MSNPSTPKQANKLPGNPDDIKQLSLPLEGSSSAADQGSGFNDPAFVGNKTLPIHRWVPWIAGFASDFVRDALRKYVSADKATILDPFAGVGTTLVEAALSGYNVYGFEINPYPALAARVKVQSYQINVTQLQT